MGGRERYFSFIKADEIPTVLDKVGNKVLGFATGHALMEHFDKVRQMLNSAKLEEVAVIAKQLSGDVPLPSPVLTK